ncbi:MAG: hypothetical protein M9894_28995 [Planctomycetes bacterium]|nr:hypothetical protein [Planctomycetota bacterium]
MTDERLRHLRRAAADDPAARAALLCARLRAGDLPEDRLRLAAHLGDPAALEVLGAAPPTPSLGRWVHGLAPWSQEDGWPAWAAEAYARAAAAAAAAVVTPCLARDPDQAQAAARALAAMDAWLACPCDAHARAVVAAGAPFQPARAGPAALFAGRVRRLAEGALARMCGVPLVEGPARATATEVATTAARATSADAVRERVREALVPWALRP